MRGFDGKSSVLLDTHTHTDTHTHARPDERVVSLRVHSGPWFNVLQLRHAVNAKRWSSFSSSHHTFEKKRKKKKWICLCFSLYRCLHVLLLPSCRSEIKSMHTTSLSSCFFVLFVFFNVNILVMADVSVCVCVCVIGSCPYTHTHTHAHTHTLPGSAVLPLWCWNVRTTDQPFVSLACRWRSGNGSTVF